MNGNSFFNRMYEFLQQHHPALKDKYFSKSMNRFGHHPEWLFDTPHGYWGENPDNPLPPDHSARLIKLVKAMVVSAKKQIDITNLRLPTGAFKQALIEGILENSHTLTIRIVCGLGGTAALPIREWVTDVQRQLDKKRVELYVGGHIVNHTALVPIGWNHAKYIAIDGKAILSGGHNYIDRTYLGANPIFDISLKLEGPIATTAHFFSNRFWNYLNDTAVNSDYLVSLKDGTIANNRKAPLDFPEVGEALPGADVPVMAVTQPGHGLIDGYANPSLSSIYFAMGNAQNSICISQQDIGGMGGRLDNSHSEGKWEITSGHVPLVCIRDPQEQVYAEMRYFDVNLLHSLTENLVKNNKLTVRMVLTNVGSQSETGDQHGAYSNNVSVGCVFRALGWYMIKRLGITQAKVVDILSKQIAIRTIGFAAENRWRVGDKHFIGNHAKFWSVDDAVCSIGSNNFYPSTILNNEVGIMKLRTGHLQEWAVIIGNNNENVVKNLREDYFDNVYNYSVAAAFKENYIWALRDPQGFPQ